MLLGILAGLATGALWGLTFIAPRAIEPFTALDFTVARYGIFGLVSAVLMLLPRFRAGPLSARQLAMGLALGAIGYVGYFMSAAFAVRLAGAAIPPLIIGTMPVLLAIIGNRRDRSVSWRALALPLVLIAAGVLTVNAGVLSAAGTEDRDSVLLGLVWSIVALSIWVIYGIANSAVMQAEDAPDGLRWTGLQGIGAGIGSLALLPLATFAPLEAASDLFAKPEVLRFAVWALVMAIAGSWFATWFWVVASHRLPLALVAQLIVSETVFGLGYGFGFEGRWPSAAEWIGAALQLVGVAAAIATFGRRPRDPVARAPASQPA